MGGIKAHLELQNPKDVYTCGDIIRGRLVLVQSKECGLKEIVVKLKGKAKVTIGEGEYRSVLMTTLHHDETRVFPCEQVAKQASMSRYTLASGEHVYPFEFEVPGHLADTTVLPTFNVDFNRIFVRYYVKATIRRASRLTFNTRAEIDIRTSPCVDRQLLDNHALVSTRQTLALISSFESIKAKLGDTHPIAALDIDFQYPQRGLKPSSQETIDFSLAVRKVGALDSPVILTNLSLYLLRHGLYKTDVAEAKTLERVPIETFEPMHRMQFDDSGVADLSELVSNVRLKTVCLPSFSSRQIDIKYEIAVSLAFSTERGKKRIEITGDTNILPICVHNHDDGNVLPSYTPHHSEDLPPEYLPNAPIYS